MDFNFSVRSTEYRERLLHFMSEWIYPNEIVFDQQVEESGDPHFYPPILEVLKAEARKRGLWNLFQSHAGWWGEGFSNLDYAPLAEIMGRSPIASEACNCSAPDTGNMEVLTMFGTLHQKEKWLRPLLNGDIRSAFGMTEPDVASSDATNVSLRIKRDGDHYVLDGRKWWTTNAFHKNLKILIVMGKTDLSAQPYHQQSQILVPADTPGLTFKRNLKVFGFIDNEGHGETLFDNVRVPVCNLIANEGDGFMISQARLGPGRIHHCMRIIGAAERALEIMCQRALNRSTFGQPIAQRANIQDWIAEARIELEMIRLLTLKTAWLMDSIGSKGAKMEIAAIKVAVPNVALKIIDRAIQVHGAAGICQDFPLAYSYANIRGLRLADGPDEVHKRTIARGELRKYKSDFQVDIASVASSGG